MNLAAVLVHNHQHAVALSHCDLNGSPQSFIVFFLYLKFVDHHFDIMIFISIYFHPSYNFFQFAVYANIKISLATHTLKQLTIMSFTLAYQWSKNENTLIRIITENHCDNFLFGIFHHLLARRITISRSGTGIEQTKIVVYLGSCAHGRTWILVSCFLLDANHRAQSRDFVYIWAFHSTQEIACIGREGFDIPALSLGEDRVECQR